ncbi:MAG: serine hydrolase, partial [bacterium]|nr:serine hydrolase [bacterium]
MLSKKVFIFSFFIFFTGLILGALLNNLLTQKKIFTYQPVRLKGFQYISPLLYCESASDENNDFTKKLSTELQKYIIEKQDSNLAQNISVYFNFLKTGDWISINESEKYTPASLLKVPTMIAYYNQTRIDPNALSREIKFEGGNDNDMENIKPTQELEQGKSYTIDSLIDRMIAQSDNNAKNLLAANINAEEFYKIFDEIGIGRLNYEETENFMNVKKFASFFRILYNASYLNRRMSEKALNLLTKVKFNQGISAGVPQGTEIAHKFGERSYGLTDIKQLHDCGIVYAPNHPYILCVMTRGNSFENLQNIISEVSSKTYEA